MLMEERENRDRPDAGVMRLRRAARNRNVSATNSATDRIRRRAERLAGGGPQTV